jgi:hypothetical protein
MDSKERIMTYLDKLCQSDENLADKMASQPLKTPDKMMVYITNQARELAKGGNSICIEDSEVFKWARHYWNDYEEKEEVKTPTKTKEIVQDDDNEMSLFDEEKPKAPKVAKKVEKPKEEFMSLFDFC